MAKKTMIAAAAVIAVILTVIVAVKISRSRPDSGKNTERAAAGEAKTKAKARQTGHPDSAGTAAARPPVSRDFAAEAESALRESDEKKLLDILADWVARDGAAAASWALSQTRGVFKPVIKMWVGADPSAAAEWAKNTMSAREGKDGVLMLCAWKLAEGSPDKAKKIVEELPESPLRNWSMIGAASELAKTDPAAARQWISGLAGNGPDGQRMTEFALLWAEKGPEAAFENASKTQRFSGDIMFFWAQKDPDSMSAWAEKLPEDDMRRINAVMTLQTESGAPPESIMETAMRAPDGRARDFAVTRAGAEWAGRDPAAALAWADRQPDSRSREMVLNAALVNLARRDPAAAEAWAMRQSGERRERALDLIRRSSVPAAR
jgi:hypothetical protein